MLTSKRECSQDYGHVRKIYPMQTTVEDKESGNTVAAVNCYFMSQDGSMFKAQVHFSPYFYLQIKVRRYTPQCTCPCHLPHKPPHHTSRYKVLCGNFIPLSLLLSSLVRHKMQRTMQKRGGWLPAAQVHREHQEKFERGMPAQIAAIFQLSQVSIRRLHCTTG